MPITGMNITSVKAGYNAVLTTHAHGWTNDEFVGKYICPFVPVDTRTGSIVVFDDSAFERYDDNRAPGGPYNVMEAGYDSTPYKLNNKGLAFQVPEEEEEEAQQASIVYGRDIAQPALMQAESLNVEIEQAQMLTNTANYGSLTTALTGTNRFDDPGSNPGELVRSYLSACTARPNVILAGQEVTDALCVNPVVKAQFHPTSPAAIDDEMLAKFFGVRKYITGRARWRNPATNVKEYIWGKNLIAAHVNPRAIDSGMLPSAPVAGMNRRSPSAFYTYVYKGHPRISNPFWDELHDSWFYKIKWERNHYATGMESAYLLQTCVS